MAQALAKEGTGPRIGCLRSSRGRRRSRGSALGAPVHTCRDQRAVLDPGETRRSPKGISRSTSLRREVRFGYRVRRALSSLPGGWWRILRRDTPELAVSRGSYKKLRVRLLNEQRWDHVSRLGPGAFETIGGERVNIALTILSDSVPRTDHLITGIDASEQPDPFYKAAMLLDARLSMVRQSALLKNPDARFTYEVVEHGEFLSAYSKGLVGIQTGDNPFYMRHWWEVAPKSDVWG